MKNTDELKFPMDQKSQILLTMLTSPSIMKKSKYDTQLNWISASKELTFFPD